MSVTFFALIADQQDVDLERYEVRVTAGHAREIENTMALTEVTETDDHPAGELPAQAFLDSLLIAQSRDNDPRVQRYLNQLWDLAHEARDMAARAHKTATIAWS
jgi:hypothetical protein